MSLPALAAAAGIVAERFSERRGRDPGAWWVAALIRAGIAKEPLGMTRSPFGSLFSMESERPDDVRVAVQPGDGCSPGELEAILDRAGPPGARVARLFRSLGAGDGWRRGDWKIALGAGEDDVRAYLGLAPGRSLVPRLPELRALGFWPPRLATGACELLERLRPAVLPTGVARRFGGPAAFKIYMDAVVALRAPLLDLVAEAEPAATGCALREFCERMDALSGAPRPHMWTVAIDAGGELADWKLELLHGPGGAAGLLDRWAELAPALAWAEDAARQAGIAARPVGASFRARAGADPSVVLYLRFEPRGYSETREPA